MENITYIFDVNGKEVAISTQEIVKLYGPHYGLMQKEVGQYAARYVRGK